MPSDPLPEPPSNQNVRDAEWFDKGWKAAMRRIAEGEQEARTLARAEVLDAIEKLRQYDGTAELFAQGKGGGPYSNVRAWNRCLDAVLAALSRLGERE